MKAVAYIRVSSTGQLDGDGPERQRIAIERFAQTAGYRIDREFVEDISGTRDAKRREVFQELLAYCAATGTSHVFVANQDAVARECFSGMNVICSCQDAGVALVECTTGTLLTTKNPYEAFSVRVRFALAEYLDGVKAMESGAAQ